jgi:hypothetical protein
MHRTVRARLYMIEWRNNHYNSSGGKERGLKLTRAPCLEHLPWLGTWRSRSVGETVQSTSEPARRGSKLDCAPCYAMPVKCSMRTQDSDRSKIALGTCSREPGWEEHGLTLRSDHGEHVR